MQDVNQAMNNGQDNYYSNSHDVFGTKSDVSIIFKLNGKPCANVYMSYNQTKDLLFSLTRVMEALESAIGQEVISSGKISDKIKAKQESEEVPNG